MNDHTESTSRQRRTRKTGPRIYRYSCNGKEGLIRARSKSRAANALCRMTLRPATAEEVAEELGSGGQVIEADDYLEGE